MQRPTGAIYTRFSDSERQKPTSCEDQMRECLVLADRYGYEVPPELIFCDAGITGQRKGLDKRDGYRNLLTAWAEGRFEALFVDEVSRLARDGLEHEKLIERIVTSGVRLVGGDGTDSSLRHWQLNYRVKSAVSVDTLETIAAEVRRGMVGQLERGFAIAAPPFGYERKVIFNDAGRQLGTHWYAIPQQAELIQMMYAMRYRGATLVDVARELNERGIPTSRDGAGYWRPSAIFQLLRNSIYKGIFTWNGSSFARTKARKQRREPQTQEFPRPELRLVSDDVWGYCNRAQGQAFRRGGRRSLLAGVVACGNCNAKLSICGATGVAPQLYCAQCSDRRRVAGGGLPMMGYVAVKAVNAAIVLALSQLLREDVLVEFRDILRRKLTGGISETLATLEQQAEQASQRCERLARRLRDDADEDAIIERLYREAKGELRRVRAELQEAQRGKERIDRRAIERQLNGASPFDQLPRLFSEPHDIAATQSILSRLFSRICLVARPRRGECGFAFTWAPGVAVAVATGTATQVPAEELTKVMQVNVHYDRKRKSFDAIVV